MRISGLASGMDIDELVKKLMSAEKAPLNKLYQKKQIYEWQRDAYRSVNTKLKTFDTYIADNFILKNLTSKTVTSSNPDLVSAVATGKASGTLSIEGVSQLATAARGLGNQIDANGSTKLSTLFDSPENMPTEIKLSAIDAQGKLADSVSIKIDKDMTIDDFVSKINSSNAGVSAIFEGNRLSITAKNTGREINGNDAISTDANGSTIFAKLGLSDLVTEEGKNAIFKVNGIATERTSNSFTINGYNVTLKNTFNSSATINGKLTSSFNERNNAQKAYNIKDGVYKTKEAEHKTAESNYNTAIDKLIQGNLSPDQIGKYSTLSSGAILTHLDKDKISILKSTIDGLSEEDAKAAIANLTKEQGFTEEIKTQLANTNFEDLKTISNLNEDDFNAMSAFSNLEQTYANTNKQALKDLASTGIPFDDIAKEIKNIDFTKEDPLEGIADPLKTALSNFSIDSLKSLQNVSGENLERMSDLADKQLTLNKAKNEYNIANTEKNEAEARFNNAEASFKQLYKEHIYKGDEADFEKTYKDYLKSLNDSSTAPQIPGDTTTVPAVTLTSTTNVDEMMTKIKDFVNTYNGFIKDLTAQTKESKYRDYPPLTDEQKEAMSENEIKLWEEKAKSGLLRNDSLIREGLASMRSLIYQSNPGIDSKYNSLYSIGITTSKNYNDGGTLEIDEDKLRKVLEEDPDAVEKLFKNSDGKEKDLIEVQENGQTVTKEVDTRGFLYNLRSSMKTFELNIEKKAGRSTMTDVQYTIGKSLIDTESRIDTWKRKLETIEARYWKQFSAMESAINKANSQASMFMQGQ